MSLEMEADITFSFRITESFAYVDYLLILISKRYSDVIILHNIMFLVYQFLRIL